MVIVHRLRFLTDGLQAMKRRFGLRPALGIEAVTPQQSEE
jgi:hypothetical protein